jgi:hypothetical protein
MMQSRGLYGLFFKRIKEAQEIAGKEIIPFPVLFSKICGNFSIPKKDCWEILFFVRDMGLIEIVPFKGVRVITNLNCNITDIFKY